MVLTERDISLFRFLFNYKVATVGNIHEYCFPGSHLENARKRINRLAKLKYIRTGGTQVNGRPIKTHYLGRLGFEVLVAADKLGPVSNIKLKSDSPWHDIVLSQVGESMRSRVPITSYVTENGLAAMAKHTEDPAAIACIDLNSDGYVHFKYKGEIIKMAVEYEHSTKSSKKYASLVNRYYEAEGINGVFYFYRKDFTRRAIMTAEKQYWSDYHPRFYFLKVQNGSELDGEMIFQTRINTKLTI